MIEAAPKMNSELTAKAIALLEKSTINSLVNEINESYLYWSEVKYKTLQRTYYPWSYGPV